MKPVLISLWAMILGMSSAYAQDHSGHEDNSENAPWSQADAYFDPAEMAASRSHVLHHNGDQAFGMVMLNRAEVQMSDDEEIGVWDGSAWYGGDTDRLYLKTEGEYSFDEGDLEEAEVQLLWSRAVSPYFDLQAGVRYDFEPEGRAHAVLGFQGLAPYWFEVDGALYLSDEGDLTADLEAEYELLLTQRLILQPRLELAMSAQDIPELETGAGFTSVQAGLRLRYEIKREFAPYVGWEYHSALGDTADYVEAAGGEKDQAYWVLGIRTWF
ncbi:copper resistance protein B [Hyphomonas pacifica]|uniref:Uncharacterized protein n=1 Tax=Hyphomonas pacifica TaxID=1280941 RepID=A0A062TSK3_9PROT|nr:copper resistance protein B [Hyphomonas pacifica]KCZ45496.1 hypothetical protein HY2_06585 [Hyphomonas pacifica]RAN35668.1 hypothetical protein HY3_07555 [Hyphomonas pacifica]